MIYSIGTSNRSLPEFLNELQKRGVTQLIDVRSSPYSRFPWFSRPKIEQWGPRAGLMYRFEGQVLGGNAGMALDDPRYVDALDRVLAASSREPIAIMCAEGDPAQCHRTWSVAASLLIRFGVVVRSILRDGGEEHVTETLTRVSSARMPPVIASRLAASFEGLGAAEGPEA